MAKTTQLDSPAWVPTSPSCKPDNSGVTNGLKGPDLQRRTSSPNAETEIVIMSVPDSGAKMTIK
jgi:hypothetical protein